MCEKCWNVFESIGMCWNGLECVGMLECVGVGVLVGCWLSHFLDPVGSLVSTLWVVVVGWSHFF